MRALIAIIVFCLTLSVSYVTDARRYRHRHHYVKLTVPLPQERLTTFNELWNERAINVQTTQTNPATQYPY